MLSEYKRFISYIYAYDRGIKSKNVGFAKMEVRDGECRITINVKGAFAASGRELEAYLFYRRQEKLIGIKIGSFSVKNGTGEIRVVTAGGNICGSGFTLEQMNGIMLCHSGETARVYASGWDDHGVIPENFMPMNDRAVSEVALTVEKEELTAAEVTPVMEAVEEELARLSASINAAQSELESLMPEQPLEIQSEQPEVRCVEETERIEQPEFGHTEEPEHIEQPELGHAQEQEEPMPEPELSPSDRAARVHNGLWGRLENIFPKVVAFEDDPEIPCLKIDLKDLECLPRENWGLANNSFLLHGYYNFRYLILAKMGENQYMIGVPGMFHNNERFMAAMFGFDHFKPVKEYKPLTGHFGYWYQWIAM